MNNNQSSTNPKPNNAPLDPLAQFGSEVRGYAMAAVILEEWLQELAAIAQEQSVLTKEILFKIGIKAEIEANQQQLEKSNNNSAILETPPVMILADDMEASMSWFIYKKIDYSITTKTWNAIDFKIYLLRRKHIIAYV